MKARPPRKDTWSNATAVIARIVRSAPNAQKIAKAGRLKFGRTPRSFNGCAENWNLRSLINNGADDEKLWKDNLAKSNSTTVFDVGQCGAWRTCGHNG